MDAFSLIGFALAAALLAFTVKEYNARAAVFVSIAGGAAALLLILGKLGGLADEFRMLADMSSVKLDTVEVMIKAAGIAYAAQFASQLCRDMGEGALAVKTEMIGRIMLLSLALPVIKSIAELLKKLTEGGMP